MDKLRVLQVSNQLGLGGTDKTVEVLSKNLNKHYFEVFVAGIAAGGPRQESLQAAGIATFVVNGDLQMLRRRIEELHIDVVNLHHVGVPLEFLPNTRVVLTHQFSKRLYELQPELRLANLVFNSTRTLQKYMSSYNLHEIPDNAEIIYNPIDVSEIEQLLASVTSADIIDYRRSLGIGGDDFVIGRFGRDDIVKWSDMLIEAGRAMKGRDGNVRLLVQTAPASRIDRLKDEFGANVVILPETASSRDLALFFSAIDVYVHASKIGESFGVSIAEAMAFKKPVVVNSTPRVDNAQIELVDNGQTGFVVQYPETFGQAVLRLKCDAPLRIQMGEMGFRKIKAKYAADIVTRQYERILLDLVDLDQFPHAREYVRTLQPPPITRAEMNLAFDDYHRRLTHTFGTMTRSGLVRHWSRQPARMVRRLADYIEWRRRTT